MTRAKRGIRNTLSIVLSAVLVFFLVPSAAYASTDVPDFGAPVLEVMQEENVQPNAVDDVVMAADEDPATEVSAPYVEPESQEQTNIAEEGKSIDEDEETSEAPVNDSVVEKNIPSTEPEDQEKPEDENKEEEKKEEVGKEETSKEEEEPSPETETETQDVAEVATVGRLSKAYLGYVNQGVPTFDPAWEALYLSPSYVSPKLSIDAVGDTLQLATRLLWAPLAYGDISEEGASTVPGEPAIGSTAQVDQTAYSARIAGQTSGSAYYSDWNPKDTSQALPALYWQSSDPLVAEIDAAGRVTAKSTGSTSITALVPSSISASGAAVIASIEVEVGALNESLLLFALEEGEEEEVEALDVTEVATVGRLDQAYLGYVDTNQSPALPIFDAAWGEMHLNPSYVSPQLSIDTVGDTLQLATRLMWAPLTYGGTIEEGATTVPGAPTIGEVALIDQTAFSALVTGQSSESIYYSDWNPTDTTQALPSILWQSSNSLVAEVDAAGRVTAKSIGSTSITARIPNTISASGAVVIAKIEVKVGTYIDNSVYSILIGTVDADSNFTPKNSLEIDTQAGQIQLAALAMRKNGTTTLYQNGTGLQWNSSNTTVATVSNTGLLRAVSNGTASISVSINTVSGIVSSVPLTVTNQNSGGITDPNLIKQLYIGYRPYMGALPIYTYEWWFASPTISQRGGTVDLLAATFTAGGSAVQPPAGAILWRSIDDTIATVNATTGQVTAVSDGTVTIVAYLASDSSIQDFVSIRVFGQSELGLPVQIDVTDKDGVPYGDKGILFDGSDAQIRLYATITYTSGQTKSSALETIEDIEWSLTNVDIAYIEPSLGYFVAKDDGIVRVIVRVPNGMGDGGFIYGDVWVTIDSGKYGTDDPGGSGTTPSRVTVELLFEEDETQTVYKEMSWSWGELASMANMQSSYTFIQGVDPDTGVIHYIQSNARGVPFTTFTQALGVTPSDIQMFRIFPVGSAQGQYGGGMSVSYDWLFSGGRYFFSMIGRNGEVIGGAQQVYPMLATSYNRYSVYSDKSNTTFVPGDFSALNPCSRLMFGSASTSDVNYSRSVHSIERIVIFLKGDLPVHFGDGDPGPGGGGDTPGGGNDGPGGGGNEDTGDGTGGDGNGDGDEGNGIGGGSGDGTGGGQGTDSGNSGQGQLGDVSEGGGSQSDGAADNSSSSSSGGADAADAEVDANGVANATGTGVSKPTWRAFQMMNDIETVVEPVATPENPYVDMSIYFVFVVVASGIATMTARFREQRRQPVWQPTPTATV